MRNLPIYKYREIVRLKLSIKHQYIKCRLHVRNVRTLIIAILFSNWYMHSGRGCFNDALSLLPSVLVLYDSRHPRIIADTIELLIINVNWPDGVYDDRWRSGVWAPLSLFRSTCTSWSFLSLKSQSGRLTLLRIRYAPGTRATIIACATRLCVSPWISIRLRLGFDK